MSRLTIEQKKLAGGMEVLLDLYHTLESMQGQAWFFEPVIKSLPDTVVKKIAVFLDRVIPNFSPALFFPEKGLFRFRSEGTSIRVNIRRHFMDFLDLMCALTHDYLMGEMKGCLKVEKAIYETTGEPGANPSRLLSARSETGAQSATTNAVFKTIHPPTQKGKRASLKCYIKSAGSKLNPPPSFYETFEVGSGSHSEFYSQLMTTDLPLDPNEDSPIMSPKDGKESSFVGVVRYFLVKYWVVLGSFERLKACNWCGKLLLEKKLGTREFCGGLCRKQYHDASQPREKRLCRERQNFWISSHAGSGEGFRVYQYECEKCKTCRPSGSCPVIERKNPKTTQEDKLVQKQKRKKNIIRAHRKSLS